MPIVLRRHVLAVAATVALGAFWAPGWAVAAPTATATPELDALRGELRKAEAAVTPLHDRRARLEADATRLAAQIDAEKRKPTGVRRDLDLQSLLAASKTKTDELERVQAELRWREPGLVELRRRVVRAIDVALAPSARALPEATRLELERLRAATVATLTSPAAPLAIAGDKNAVAADPLDGPRELRQKADLLRDSGDKLRREARRIAERLDSVERRRRLRERAGALDEDLFGELQSNRRVARAQGTTAAAAQPSDARPTAADASGSSPAPALPGSPTGGVQGGGANSVPSLVTPPTTRSADSTVLRNLVDPSTLDELRRADALDDADRQTRALKKAQSELETLAKELERRAQALEGRAEELKRQK